MNSTIEIIEQEEQYWPEFIFGWNIDEGDDECNA